MTQTQAADNFLTQHNNWFMANAEYTRNRSFENYGKMVYFRNARTMAITHLEIALNRRLDGSILDTITIAEDIVHSSFAK